MVGLTIGTGLGSGIILNNKLYAGANCGAGEFGMIKYLDDVYEYYASGQFFENIYHINGEVVFKLAAEGNPDAIQMYREFGTHLGNAIKMIMYSYDMQLIVLGGSVRIAWPYFHESMWEAINSFAYPRSVKGLKIMISELENSGVLGAASLHYDITD
jgi:glucokinase